MKEEAKYMELGILAKLATALSTLSGAIVIWAKFFRSENKIEIESIEKLDEAISNGRRHTTCLLFSKIYKVTLGYDEIIKITESEDFPIMLEVVRKYSGIFEMKNGSLVYNGLKTSSLYWRTAFWLLLIGILVNLVALVSSLISLFYVNKMDGSYLFVWFLIFISSSLIVFLYRGFLYNLKVKRLLI